MTGRRAGGSDARRSNFKFNAMTNDELRRRREETQVEIRKAKREDSLNKRRNILEGAVTTPAVSMSELRHEVPRASQLSATELAQRLPDMVQPLYSQDLAAQLKSVVDFRKLLAKEKNAPIQEVVDCGVVPRFVEILAGRSVSVMPEDAASQKTLEELQFEAAWVLTNIASGEPEHTMTVVQAHAVPVFIQLMRHHNVDIRDQCIWALGNIAGDGARLRDYVLQENIMSPLLENLVFALDNGAQPITAIRNGAWTISNLCRGSPAPSWNQIVVALPVLFRLLQLQDDDTLVDTCWALCYMTSEPDVVADVVQSGIVPSLVPRLAHPSVSVIVPALRSCGNIVSGAEVQTQAVVDAGALPLLRNLLQHNRVAIVKETCWVLSNITAGTPDQIQAVLDSNVIPKVLHHLSFSEMKVKKEACWVVCNATAAHETHPHQVKYLIAQGCIKPLCQFLERCQEEPRLTMVVLDGLANILQVGEYEALVSPDTTNPYAILVEEAGGLDLINNLQDHKEFEIYTKAKDIIDKYFDGEEEDEFTMESSGGFEFKPSASMPQGGFNF